MRWIQSIDWLSLVGNTPLEIIATLCAVAGVVCIARQNRLGWPLGILWAGISAWLAFVHWHLLSDGILYLSCIPIQIYCWMMWCRYGSESSSGQNFKPTWLPRRRQGLLLGLVVVSILVWGSGIAYAAQWISWLPTPELLWRDSTTTVLNYYAQFLQARKRMENWVGWVVVNILGIHIYWVKDAPVYSLQYAIFLGLGLYGWHQWKKECV